MNMHIHTKIESTFKIIWGSLQRYLIQIWGSLQRYLIHLIIASLTFAITYSLSWVVYNWAEPTTVEYITNTRDILDRWIYPIQIIVFTAIFINFELLAALPKLIRRGSLAKSSGTCQWKWDTSIDNLVYHRIAFIRRRFINPDSLW